MIARRAAAALLEKRDMDVDKKLSEELFLFRVSREAMLAASCRARIYQGLVGLPSQARARMSRLPEASGSMYIQLATALHSFCFDAFLFFLLFAKEKLVA